MLSGGEPTLHPRLPGDHSHGVRAGLRLGADHHQRPAPGYPAYLHALIDAGLREVTFSLHGSGPDVHDAVVGVPGAFEQAFAGCGRHGRRPDRRVDVVLNRRNLADAPALVRRTLDAGVREYDILWLTPFGAAAEGLGRRRNLFLGPADAPAVHRVLDEGPRRRTVVWTNRMPLAYLEGREDLVQDPSKLEDELRGRRDMIDPLDRRGRPLPCREPDRCPRCPFDAYCAVLHRAVATARGELQAPIVRWDRVAGAGRGCAGFRLPPRPGCAPGTGFGLARPPRGAPALAARSLRAEARPAVLAASLAALPSRATLQLRDSRPGRPLPAALRRTGHEVVVPLTAALALRAEPSALVPEPGRLVPALPDVATGRRDGWPLERGSAARVRRWLGAARAVEGLPPCLAGRRKVRAAPEPFDLRWLGADGRVDRYAVLHDFVEESHRAWSLRCAGCAARRGCGGLGWEMARTVGLGVLRPFPRA